MDCTLNIITNSNQQEPTYKTSSTYKWRISNPDKYIVLSRKHSLNYYYRHREKILQEKRQQYNEQIQDIQV